MRIRFHLPQSTPTRRTSGGGLLLGLLALPAMLLAGAVILFIVAPVLMLVLLGGLATLAIVGYFRARRHMAAFHEQIRAAMGRETHAGEAPGPQPPPRDDDDAPRSGARKRVSSRIVRSENPED
jgi:hypothetical protein